MPKNKVPNKMLCLKQPASLLLHMALPISTRRWLRARMRGAPGPCGIDFGDLRRKTPFSSSFGFDRGLPVDRYYIENFLSRYSGDIRGHVLEIKENAYTRRFGKERVEKSDILDIDKNNPKATIVADLTRGDGVPDNTFDCIVLTQTLQLIFNPSAALGTCFRILKPGGILLATVPGISQMDYKLLGHTWFWSFTEASMQRLLNESFGRTNALIAKHGNVLAASCFLHGVAAAELSPEELDHQDPDYQLLITVRAVKT